MSSVLGLLLAVLLVSLTALAAYGLACRIEPRAGSRRLSIASLFTLVIPALQFAVLIELGLL